MHASFLNCASICNVDVTNGGVVIVCVYVSLVSLLARSRLGHIVDHLSFPLTSISYICWEFQCIFVIRKFCHLRIVSDTYSFHHFHVKFHNGFPLGVLLLLSGDI